jgi:NTP pyrophosphatase (non-canonical NTP hydrolase)
MTALSDNILASSYKDFDYYAKQAIRTMAFYRNNDEKILNAALGLAGEAGEIVETIKRYVIMVIHLHLKLEKLY